MHRHISHRLFFTDLVGAVMAKKKIKPGDYITFKAATRWSSGNAKVRRKVVSIYYNGYPCVRFGGWSDFVVRPNEIIEVESAT